MTAKVIYFEKVTPAAREMIEASKGDTEVSYWVELDEAAQQLALAQAKYLVASVFPINGALLDKAPNVRLVQKTGAGLDNIDIAAADERGVLVSSTPGVNSSTVAELTIGMILNLFRKINFMDREIKQGKWLMWEYRPFMFEMKGKTHGIIGLGNVGKEVAKLSLAFGTRVIYYDIARLSPEREKELGVTFATFEELLAGSDIVSLHIPLTPLSRNMISTKELALMKPNAVLINVARGNIVDEQALAEALKAGRLLGAGTDVWASEPVKADNPLLQLDNIVGSPHLGGGTRDVMERVFELSFANVRRLEAGESPIALAGKAVLRRD
ncbi:MAG: 2-hydroxyacid dehydrogenase [Negativicutes bacterium]|nr:2-hydroxyacid dehydrogenase [Negativicutes bacterium]